ncbi:hypothetical protein AB6C60_03455 [Vibrio cyclitrophicus]|uniref:hypothetical protein n=1 Tax=Vibrio sp. S/42/10 TaxID=2914757 RepID=UPI0024682CAB|nr:hypothetical protein [Vibrio sp. S/42/10]
MNDFDVNLDKLGQIRDSLVAPKPIWSLARKLKQQSRTLALNAPNSDLSLPSNPGIYYFEAKFNFKDYEYFEDFGNSWGVIRSKNLPKGVSRYYPSRAKNHIYRLKQGKYIPLYLGKRDNLSDRIINHLDGSEESGTYALKLRSRPELLSGVELRYIFHEFNINPRAFFGVEVIEKALREVFNPIIGKQ